MEPLVTVVAPGAEQAGQAQILNTFSKPSELEGLFGAADAGAFGGGSGDVPMVADEDGDIFWDAVEGKAMEEDGNQMESDELRPRIPMKRSRSPSIALINEMQTGSSPSVPTENERARQPKRQRKNKDIPEYDARPDDHVLRRMYRGNPLSRKTLEKEAKRARKLIG